MFRQVVSDAVFQGLQGLAELFGILKTVDLIVVDVLGACRHVCHTQFDLNVGGVAGMKE